MGVSVRAVWWGSHPAGWDWDERGGSKKKVTTNTAFGGRLRDERDR